MGQSSIVGKTANVIYHLAPSTGNSDDRRNNTFGYLISHTRRYRDVVSAPLESLQFNLAYLLGMRLQNAKDAVSRTDVDRLNPSLEDDQQAALDTVLGFHGLFVLSSKAGQDLHAKARAYQATRDDIQKLSEAARQLKEAVLQTKEFVTDDVKDVIDQAASEIGHGRFPEREAIVAETTIGNFLSLAGQSSLFAASAAAGGIIENMVVDSLVGRDLVGLGVNVINVAGATAKQFLLQHQMMLKGLAEASKEGLAWLPHFIDWLKFGSRAGGDDQNPTWSDRQFPNLPTGTLFRDISESWCPEMVMIPAGTFMMGSPETEEERLVDEGPQHEVTITQSFALGRYLITFGEYDHFCDETGREKPEDEGWGRGRRPVINVSHEDAEAYCAWLRTITNLPYCLPTEAMWEYACRAGTNTAYAFGNDFNHRMAHGSVKTVDQVERFDDLINVDHVGRTAEVGAYPQNPWGLFDMHGNVREWCCDERWCVDRPCCCFEDLDDKDNGSGFSRRLDFRCPTSFTSRTAITSTRWGSR